MENIISEIQIMQNMLKTEAEHWECRKNNALRSKTVSIIEHHQTTLHIVLSFLHQNNIAAALSTFKYFNVNSKSVRGCFILSDMENKTNFEQDAEQLLSNIFSKIVELYQHDQ